MIKVKVEENNNYIVNTIECSSIDYGIGLINTYINNTEYNDDQIEFEKIKLNSIKNLIF